MTTDTSAAAGFREFKMPDVGEGLTEAEILKWYVAPGDSVTDGQVVCEVETAKAAVELPIPYDGVVRELRFEEGATVDVGAPIITVDVTGGAAPQAAPPAPEGGAAGAAPATNGVEPPAPPARTPVLVGYGVAESSTKRRPRRGAGVPGQGAQTPAAPAGVAAPHPVSVPVPETAAVPTAVPETAPVAETTAVPGTTATPQTTAAPERAPAPAPAAAPAPSPVSRNGERPLAKPPVRKLAKDLGVDLTAIVPTGPDGIVTREDVHAAVAPAVDPGAAQAPTASVAAPAPQAPAAGDTVPGEAAAPGLAGPAGARETRTPIKGVRRATAAAMVGSAFTAPHVTEFVTVDVTRSVKLVEELRADRDMAGLRVNPLLLIARALLVAIRRNPDVNASWDEANQEIVRKHYVNLGIAAATPRGLIVPNIKDAQDKTLPQLAASLADLVSTAREGRTSPGAMQGGTVTITNVGVFGIDSGTPILNPGEAAILAVGAIKLQPWVHKGKVKPRQVTTLALSFDHRLVDGELGSKVLGDVAAVLEQPKRLITWT